MGGRRAVLTFGLVAGLLTAQDLPKSATTATPGIPVHETLEYEIEWRLIPAGTAALTWAALNNNTGSGGELRLHLESAGLVSRLFRVNDDYTASLGQN